jgi:hypothetical protein
MWKLPKFLKHTIQKKTQIKMTKMKNITLKNSQTIFFLKKLGDISIIPYLFLQVQVQFFFEKP